MSPHYGRVYLVWDRYPRGPSGYDRIVVNHSDDGGRTWSSPRMVRGTPEQVNVVLSGIAVGANGNVYLTWVGPQNDIWVDRSTDGGEAFGNPVRVDYSWPSTPPFISGCTLEGATFIPADSRRCVWPSPSIAVQARRVVVVYTVRRANGLRVAVRTLGRRLRSRSPVVFIRPEPAARTDQFMPVATADRRRGLIWACWYDTEGDPSRRSVLFTCSASRDGRRWATSLPVASVRSDETGPSADAIQYGDYQGVAVGADGLAHPVWTDSRDLSTGYFGEEIYTTAVKPSLFGF